MNVLDASALLALLGDEAGAEVVAGSLDGAVLGAANYAEVIGKLGDRGVDTRDLGATLETAGVRIEPVTAADGELAGVLRQLPGGAALSLGDRCCLSLACRVEHPVVLTADRAWVDLELPVKIRLVR